jgi:hypothetical protein
MAPFSPPKLRGNSSYQAAWAARGRSTHSRWGADEERRASGTPATSPATSSSKPAASRTSSVQLSRRTPSAAVRNRFLPAAPLTLVASSSRMRAPSSSSSSTSCPAAAFTSISWRQVA